MTGCDSTPLPAALAHWPALQQQLAGKRLALFLDYDGTLTPIVAHPEQALLDDALRTVVATLARRCVVAIVSGRELANVRAKVGLDTVYYAGDHGFAIQGPPGSAIWHEQGAEFLADLAAARDTLEPPLRTLHGAVLEAKRYSFTVHYRQVAEAQVAAVAALVDGVLAEHGNLRKHYGKKVFEVRPRLDWHKGKAVLWLLKALKLDGDDVLPLYIGDDVTDEDAFRALSGRGIGILVSDIPRSSAAAYRLHDVTEVGQFLRRLAACV